MSTAYWITGDTLATLREMPAGSVDLVMTSPPFLALRSYLPADDPAKALEIGQEGTPGAFLDVLLDITEELRRVLAPHGSICVELGDTYSGSGGAGGDYADDGMRDGQPVFRQVRSDDGWPLAKSACLIPELYRMALAYGRNPLTGRECSRWRIRNTIRWVRPNPPVGALGDKFRPATSEMVIATMARDRYFDLDAVRQPGNAFDRDGEKRGSKKHTDEAHHIQGGVMTSHPAGAPPLDWWEIPTQPYRGSHYATFPSALCEKPIKSMAPTKVCHVCGEPSRRIVETTHDVDEQRRREVETAKRADRPDNRQDKGAGPFLPTEVTTLGWTDCGHDAWRHGRVLDPFGGSGTTGAVATGHGRDFIGIDLDQRNLDLARERIGPMWFHPLSVAEIVEVLG